MKSLIEASIGDLFESNFALILFTEMAIPVKLH